MFLNARCLLALSLFMMVALPVAKCFRVEDVVEKMKVSGKKLCGNRLAETIKYICMPYGGIGKRGDTRIGLRGRLFATNDRIGKLAALESFSPVGLLSPRQRRIRREDYNCDRSPEEFARCLCCVYKEGCSYDELRDFCVDRN